MDANAKKAVVRRCYEEVWSKGNVSLVDELMSTEYENCDPATPGYSIKGTGAFKAFVGSYREAFPDLQFVIKEQWSEGDDVISRWTAQGTHKGALMGLPPTGLKPDPVEGVTITSFKNGRIVRDRAVWDLHGLLQRLGATR
jgi:steroid delta-isomerase-like uncharacterized protein